MKKKLRYFVPVSRIHSTEFIPFRTLRQVIKFMKSDEYRVSYKPDQTLACYGIATEKIRDGAEYDSYIIKGKLLRIVKREVNR